MKCFFIIINLSSKFHIPLGIIYQPKSFYSGLVWKFSNEVEEEKSQLAQKLEDNKDQVTANHAVRSLATEESEAVNPDSSTPSTPNYILFGLIGLMFLVMAYVGMKFAKKKK